MPKDLYLFFLVPVFLILLSVTFFYKKNYKIPFTLTDFGIILFFLFFNYQFYLHTRYLESLIFFYSIHFYFLLFLSYKFIQPRREVYKSYWFFLPVFILMIWVLLEGVEGKSRMFLQASVGNPVYLSVIFLFLLPLFWEGEFDYRSKFIYTVLTGGVLFILESRVAILLFVFQIMLMMGRKFRGEWFKITGLFLVMLFFLYLFPRKNLQLDANRKRMYQIGWRMLKDSSFWGLGKGVIKYKFHIYNRGGKYLNPYHLHCDLLEFAVEEGLIAAVVLLLFLLLVWFKSSFWEKIAFFSVYIFSVFHFPFYLTTFFPLFYFVLLEISGRGKEFFSYSNRGIWRLIGGFILLFLGINFYLSFSFYQKYALADYRLNSYLKNKNDKNFAALRESFSKLPYYYELAYFYGIACYERGEYEKSYRVFDYISHFRPERTIFNNRSLALRKFIEQQLKKNPPVIKGIPHNKYRKAKIPHKKENKSVKEQSDK